MATSALTCAGFPTVHYRSVPVGNLSVSYRESGTPSPDHPTLLLLHGYPTSSHMFRNLMLLLPATFHIIAPDMPGFGFTTSPDHKDFSYTFDNLAQVIDSFTQALYLDKFVLYVQDYGAPVGFRIAMAHPERITAIIVQDGNAYEEGLSDAWLPSKKYWNDPSAANRAIVQASTFSLEITKAQYTDGVADQTLIAPETYQLDWALLQRPGIIDAQLDLILDFANNVKMYPAFQKYFAASQPKMLVVFGKNDAFYLTVGAEAYKRDVPSAKVVILDTGLFGLETNLAQIAAEIVQFLA